VTLFLPKGILGTFLEWRAKRQPSPDVLPEAAEPKPAE
jgi:hypothetical protein